MCIERDLSVYERERSQMIEGRVPELKVKEVKFVFREIMTKPIATLQREN